MINATVRDTTATPLIIPKLERDQLQLYHLLSTWHVGQSVKIASKTADRFGRNLHNTLADQPSDERSCTNRPTCHVDSRWYSCCSWYRSSFSIISGVAVSLELSFLLGVYTVRSSDRPVGPTQATSDCLSDQSDRPVGQTVAEPPT